MTSLVALDIETTGLDAQKDAIIEIGAVRFNGKRIEGEWQEGVPVKQGTLYPVLRSMEENGLLWSRVEPSVSGPPRKYYQITDRGRVVLGSWRAAWARTRDFVDATLEGNVG